MAATGRIACKYCHRSTILTEAGARANGWRFYKGPSLTGKMLDDVICPVCTGEAKPEPENIPSWIVECACEWTSHENWQPGDVPILTAYEAEQVARNHRCEPEFRFISPEGKSYRDWDPEFMKELEETTPRKKTF